MGQSDPTRGEPTTDSGMRRSNNGKGGFSEGLLVGSCAWELPIGEHLTAVNHRRLPHNSQKQRKYLRLRKPMQLCIQAAQEKERGR